MGNQSRGVWGPRVLPVCYVLGRRKSLANCALLSVVGRCEPSTSPYIHILCRRSACAAQVDIEVSDLSISQQ